MPIGEQESQERFKVLATKISPEMAEQLNVICKSMGVDIYNLLQWFVYTLIRASSPQHELTPEIRRLMTMMESDHGWQQAFNLVNQNRLNVAQTILILEQEGRKGFGAVMIDKPFMSEARQTECVDTILERVTEVTMRGIYRRLRLMGAKMDCQNLSDVLLTMIDAQIIHNLDEDFRAELPGMGEHADNGKKVAFGKKSKAKQHRTPDSVATDQRIKFDDYDREVSDYEAKEWEGEWHDR